MVRSAGAGAELAGKDGKYVLIKLPSSETRLVLATCKATVGEVSNKDHGLTVIAKAGRSRWLERDQG